MLLLYSVLLSLLNLGWLALVFLGLPGNWLMVLSTVGFAWWQREAGVYSLWTLGLLVVLAGVGEILELSAGLVGARRAGSSKWGAAGALLGGMVGAIAGTLMLPVPLFGTLVGACVGAFVGAFSAEAWRGRDWLQSARSGRGAAMGHLFGLLGKLSIGVVIWATATVAAFL